MPYIHLSKFYHNLFARYEGITRLQVGIKFRPEDCTVKTEDGDDISGITFSLFASFS